jgi:hypothetical protein
MIAGIGHFYQMEKQGLWLDTSVLYSVLFLIITGQNRTIFTTLTMVSWN